MAGASHSVVPQKIIRGFPLAVPHHYEYRYPSIHLNKRSMASTKTALKAAKAALDAEKYDETIEHVKKVLTIDPNHYHAYVGTNSLEMDLL